LDFGATAKAHAADRAAWLLAQEFGCGVLVNLSGDVSVAGPPPPGGWPVRVADGEATGPGDPGQTVALHDGGAATSGTTVRIWRHGDRDVQHIIDPATGDAAAPSWLTVTAVAGSCLDANTLTTAALVRGPGILPFLRQAGCPMRLLGADGRITLLGGWPQEEL
jgi:thiamine biosynthesis lipoprotein